MNLGFLLTSRHLLWILLAPPLMAFAQCDKEVYRNLLNEFCLQQFQLNMESLGMNLWCDWKATEESWQKKFMGESHYDAVLNSQVICQLNSMTSDLLRHAA
ncbi:receptor activity-modifying protein 1 isoform X4 [Anomaloglossus baeobatrachus]|uniref:receptor activity-modifying protein 1 isoform X4 n=1 Tax=Anomaloglossus baeobatrachus TaxID=238106 RepID=UPI003F4FFBF6